MDNTRQILKEYILNEFLYGENPEDLAQDTPLITGGILDSISTLQLVQFIEQSFGVKLEAYEAGVDYLNTIDDIAKLIRAKNAG
jgi:acyl carrier protein